MRSGWYEPLLDLLPSPLLLIDPESGQVVFTNRAARDIPVPSDFCSRVAAGEEFANVQVDWEHRSLIASGGTIVPPGGSPVAVLTFEDITELDVARRRADALAEVSSLLAGSPDFDATLARIAQIAVPRLGDWCFVELLRDDGSIDRVAFHATDPELLAEVREYDRRYPLDPDAPWGSPPVIRTGKAALEPEITDAMLEAVAQDAEHLALLRRLGFRSTMIVPLRAGGRVIGDIALAGGAGSPPLRRGRPRRRAGDGRPLRALPRQRAAPRRAQAGARRVRGHPRGRRRRGHRAGHGRAADLRERRRRAPARVHRARPSSSRRRPPSSRRISRSSARTGNRSRSTSCRAGAR